MRPESSPDRRSWDQVPSTPTWADDIAAPTAPTDAASYFGHGTGPGQPDATQLSAAQQEAPGGTAEVLETLGALTFEGIDLRADIVRLVTMLTIPESPPSTEPGLPGPGA